MKKERRSKETRTTKTEKSTRAVKTSLSGRREAAGVHEEKEPGRWTGDARKRETRKTKEGKKERCRRGTGLKKRRGELRERTEEKKDLSRVPKGVKSSFLFKKKGR